MSNRMVTLQTVSYNGQKSRQEKFSFDLAEKVLAKNKRHNPAWELPEGSPYTWNEKDRVLVMKPKPKKSGKTDN